MFNIIVLSNQGEGYELIDRIKKENHIAKLWIEDLQAREIYRSILHEGQIINRYEECLSSADLVISASGRHGGVCDRIRNDGRLALGGGIQDLLIFDPLIRGSALKLMLEVPKEHVIIGAFDGEWKCLYEGVSYPRILEGNRGPITNGMGCTLWKSTLDSLGIEDLLSKAKFKGFVGVHKVFDEVYFFNPVASCYFPAFLECVRGSVVESLMQMATGKQPHFDFLCGVSSRIAYLEPQDILAINPKAEKHFWRHYEPGSWGYFAASGENPREARRRVLRSIENNIPRDCVYRRDIGDTPCRWIRTN